MKPILLIAPLGMLIVFGIYKELRHLKILIQTSSYPSQHDAYKALHSCQGCSLITIIVVAQMVWLHPFFGFSWSQFQPVAGLLGLAWFLKPLQNLFEFDPVITTIGRRLTFWGLARLWPLITWPWGVIALAIIDYAVIKRLRLLVTWHSLVNSQHSINRHNHHAISMGPDGMMVDIVDPHDATDVKVHL